MEVKIKKPQFKFNLVSLTNFFVNIGSSTLSQIFVLFVALITINIISQKYFFRIDLTQTKTYTLSNGTKNILNSLDDTVTIKTFFSDNVPPDIIPVIQDAHDLYEEYIRYAGGKIKLEIKNPNYENFSSEALEAGIPEVQYQEYSQDKYEIAQGFLGAAISYKDKTEVIELITEQNIQNLEYETSSRIYKLTTEEKPKVGFLTGHGEKSLEGDYSTIKKYLQVQFTVETVDISQGEPIDPNQIKALIIAAPTGPFSDRDKFEIDQYIMNGGRVVVLADIFNLGFQTTMLSKSQSNLGEFLSHYGVEVSESVLLDESYTPLYGLFRYPYWILAIAENFDSNNPALAQLQSLVFQWTSPLNESGTNENRKYTPLIKTTTEAWAVTGEAISADPSQNFIPMYQGQYDIAAIVEGREESMFKDQDIPELKNEGEEGEVEDKRTSGHPRSDVIEDAKIVVIGDSDFISDSFIESSEQNPVFFLNLLEWLASSKDLISIRSKNISYRPLETTTDSTKFFVKAANIGLVPVLLIGAGIAYNMVRKKRKSSI
jgi:gliding-associated putative ABC transporter substrate-binding component GldG